MGSTKQGPTKTINPDDLINRTYLMDPNENGERFRAKIVRKIVEREHEKGEELEKIDKTKFLVTIKGDQPDQIVDYNYVLDHVNAQANKELDPEHVMWKYKGIIGHEGPLNPGHLSYKGSKYNVMIAWEDGSQTFEPLHTIAQDDPVTCAIYARENDLFELDGWKRFTRLAKRDKKMIGMLNQSKLKSS